MSLCDRVHLDAAFRERLAIASEEAGEVIQILGKIHRFGFDSSHPVTGMANKAALETEIGHFFSAVDRLIRNGDLDPTVIYAAKESKNLSVVPYLKYNQT
jgi:hypothetical protein